MFNVEEMYCFLKYTIIHITYTTQIINTYFYVLKKDTYTILS